MSKLQHSTDLNIPRSNFRRLIHEIMLMHRNDFRIQSMALEILHEASEMMLVDLMKDATSLTIHRNRATLQPNDMNLAAHIKY